MTEKTGTETCLRCGKKRKSCCTLGVPLTLEDVERITSLGYKLEEFAYAGEWDEDDIEGAEDWWMDSMLKVNGKLYRLEVEEDEDERCFFLDHGKGCKLGKNRPLQCKTYPFWVEDNQIVYDDPEDRFCPINKCNMPIDDALKCVGETKETIMSYYNRIKDDCIKNREKMKELILKLVNK